MIIKELIGIYCGNIIIYTKDNKSDMDYIDLYKGSIEDTPEYLLQKEIYCFGAIRKGVIDVSIKN